MQVNPATEAMYIANPLSAFKGQGMAGLFSTHPPMEERIRRLRALDCRQRRPLRLGLARSRGPAVEAAGPWPRRRTPSTRTSTSRCPGRRRSSRSASGRSTSMRCIRTSASSSRSSSRCCSSATSRAAATSSTPSAARGRRSCRRSRAGATRPARTSRRSTSCSRASRRADYNLFSLERDVRDALRQLPEARPGPSSAFVRRWYAPRAARGAARLPRPGRRRRARRRPARDPRSRGPLGPADDALRPGLPPRPAARPVLVPQAQAGVPAGRARVALPHAATALDTVARIKAFARVACARPCRDRPARGRARARLRPPLRRRRHLAAVSGPDRLPRAAPLRVRAARAPGPRRARARSRLVEGGAGGVRRRGSRQCSPTRASTCAPARPSAWSSHDRRDLYPEILERAGLRLEERLRRHVNRRTGRRAGEFFEDVLVARA